MVVKSTVLGVEKTSEVAGRLHNIDNPEEQ